MPFLLIQATARWCSRPKCFRPLVLGDLGSWLRFAACDLRLEIRSDPAKRGRGINVIKLPALKGLEVFRFKNCAMPEFCIQYKIRFALMRVGFVSYVISHSI